MHSNHPRERNEVPQKIEPCLKIREYSEEPDAKQTTEQQYSFVVHKPVAENHNRLFTFAVST